MRTREDMLRNKWRMKSTSDPNAAKMLHNMIVQSSPETAGTPRPCDLSEARHFRVVGSPITDNGAAERIPPIPPYHIEIANEFTTQLRRFVARFVVLTDKRWTIPGRGFSPRT